MPTRNVVITSRQAEMIAELVEAGEFQNASEVMREGLRLVAERRADRKAKLKALRSAILVATDEIDARKYRRFEIGDDVGGHFRQLGEEVLSRRRK